MPDTWREAGTFRPDESPYIHWWLDKHSAVDTMEFADFTPIGGVGAGDQPYAGAGRVPIPGTSQNPSPGERDLDSTAALLPDDVPDDAVILGVVDTGICLGHRSTRLSDGGTRFIASWQQSAPFDSARSGAGQIPFGQVLHASDIDGLIQTHTHGKWLDEDAFNRDAGLVQPERVFGQRDLDRAASHGSHVLDLAAGADPAFYDEATLARQRIIAVNLPAQYAHGTAGHFLAYFAILAVDRILFLADALWRRNHPDGSPADGPTGYPVVINFSYGMQAGPKDGWHDFEAALRGFIEASRAQGRQVRVVMPVGNDNTDRCAASRVLGKAGEKDPQTYFDAEETLEIPWRILPSDGTSNFVEIWSGSLSQEDAENALAKLELDVTPPGQGRLSVGRLGDGLFFDLGDYARVYSRIKRGAPGSYRISMLVCVGPTLEYGGTLPEAPAGKWTIRLKYAEPVATDFSLFVQSDQSAVKGSKTGRRSYFDHRAYRVYENSGRLADTYHFDPGVAPVSNDDYAKFGPVQRHSTHNAISSLGMEEVLCIAGHDDLNGFPAVYSSTTDGEKSRLGGRQAPSASLPSENADSLFGLLASGSRDGSRAHYRGTSMAAALASRFIVEAILAHSGQGGDVPGTESWLRAQAQAEEQAARTDQWNQPSTWPETVPQKSGGGRLSAPDRPDRIGRLV